MILVTYKNDVHPGVSRTHDTAALAAFPGYDHDGRVNLPKGGRCHQPDDGNPDYSV